jgi:hypothetical protein
MENKDKSKQNDHDSGMFQVKEISKNNKNDRINLVLPISINGRKIDGIVDTGAQIAVVGEELEITSWLRTVFSAERGKEHYFHKACIRGHSPFQNWEHRIKMEAHCG